MRPPLSWLRMLLPGLLAGALLASSVAAAPSAELAARTREGAAHLQAGRTAAALTSFEAVLARAPESKAARRNVALVLGRLAAQDLLRKDGAAALPRLERALELHPGRLLYETQRARALLLAGRHGEALRAAEALVKRSPTYGAAWLALADVRERTGELREALEALGALRTLRPGDGVLRQRIEDVTRRADAEALYLTHGSGHFVVRYPPDADAETVRLALTILEDAYARVTAELGLAPRTPAQVVLYEGGEFQRVTGAHSWVGALYQRGVLRIPTRNLERHRATAMRVLAHEFTHHILRERTPSLPILWHEGIAQFVEQDAEAGIARRAEIGGQLKRQRERSRLLNWAEMQRLKIARVKNAGTVHLFYAQALHFVGWLVDRQGSGALPAFLTALGLSTDVEGAARRAFGSSLTDLYAAWQASL